MEPKVLELSDKYQLSNVNYWGISEISKDLFIKKTGLLEFIQKLTYKSEVSVLELVLQSKSPDLEKQKILDYIRNLITNEFLFTNLRKVAISHKDLDDLTNILKDINNQRKLTEDLLQIKIVLSSMQN